MVSLQGYELGLPEHQTRLNVFPFDLMPDNAEDESRQPGISLRVVLEVEEPPCLNAIVKRHALHNLKGSARRKANQPIVHIGGELILRRIMRRIIRRYMVDGIFAVVEGLHEVRKVHVALPHRTEELATPFFPAKTEVVKLLHVEEALLLQADIGKMVSSGIRAIMPILLHHMHHILHSHVLCMEIRQQFCD